MDPTYHNFEEDELEVSGKGTEEEVVENFTEEVSEPEENFVTEKEVVKAKLVKGIVTCDLLNVRSGPGTNYQPLLQLGNGIELFIDLEKSTEDFYCVSVNGNVEALSYAMKQFIKLV